MAGRFWSGVAVSAALGTAFCLADFIASPKPRRADPAVLPARSARPSGSRVEWEAGAGFYGPAAARPQWPANTPPENQPLAEPLRPRPPFSAATPGSPLSPAAPAPQSPTSKQTVAVPAIPALPPSAEAEADAAARPRPQPSVQSGRKGGPASMLPLRRMLMGRGGEANSRGGRSASRRHLPVAGAGSGASAPSGTASATALANLADVRDIDPTWDYYDLPEKGLDVWAGGEGFAAKQGLRDAGPGAYELDGSAYSLGLRKDWSIDSVIGASIDIFDARLTSSAMLDYRENDLAGYRLNAHYEGVAFDYLAFAVKAFYGRLDSEGGGYLQVHDQGSAWREEWREAKHGSEMYGFAGKAGLPLLWGPDIKILPEIGVNLTKLRSDPYSYVLSDSSHNERSFQVARADSTSLEIPVSVTLRKDILQSWGVLTPLLGLTYNTELDDGAEGVRTGHAAAAVMQIDPLTGNPTDIARDAGPKAFVRVDLGLELRTVGGWRMDARYAHVFAQKYTNDIFKLELGRCF